MRTALKILGLNVAIFASSVCAQGIERFEVKGIAFGISQKEFETKFPLAWCHAPKQRAMADVMCGGVRENIKCDVRGAPKTCAEERDKLYTFGGVPMNSIMANFYNDALASVRISFSAKDFDSVYAALTTRYGKPDELKTESIQNRAGAVFENTIASWRKGDSNLWVRRYSGNLDTSAADYTLDSSIAEFKKRQGDTAKKGASDL
jgi:hypothetical protein